MMKSSLIIDPLMKHTVNSSAATSISTVIAKLSLKLVSPARYSFWHDGKPLRRKHSKPQTTYPYRNNIDSYYCLVTAGLQQ
jgi:hypothetical protein